MGVGSDFIMETHPDGQITVSDIENPSWGIESTETFLRAPREEFDPDWDDLQNEVLLMSMAEKATGGRLEWTCDGETWSATVVATCEVLAQQPTRLECALAVIQTMSKGRAKPDAPSPVVAFPTA